MLTYPYFILKKRLGDNVSELRELDWYLNQDSDSDKSSMIKALPALYIEWLSVPTNDEGNRLQSGVLDFNIHLITEAVIDNDKRVAKTSPLDHMRIFDKIFQNLQGFSALISFLDEFVALKDTASDMRMFGSLSRVAITPPHQLKSMMKSTQRFRGKFYDHAATPAYQSLTPPPQIGITLEVPV